MSIQSAVCADIARETATKTLNTIKEFVGKKEMPVEVLTGAQMMYDALEQANVFSE